jgi:hypothetical protein
MGLIASRESGTTRVGTVIVYLLGLYDQNCT